jgi:hypothetical protein
MGKGMKLSEYFEKTQGIGVLATTDASGRVNQALYSRPHFPDDDDDGDESCSFIMSNRLSHDNVRHNPSASYLFIEKGEGLSITNRPLSSASSAVAVSKSSLELISDTSLTTSYLFLRSAVPPDFTVSCVALPHRNAEDSADYSGHGHCQGATHGYSQ